jgi:hypothetical protein
VAGYYNDPKYVFCRDPASGTQMTIAHNIGLPETVMVAPRCIRAGNDASLVVALIPRDTPEPGNDPYGPNRAIGFVSAAAFDGSRASVNALAYQAPGQTLAYYPDSNAIIADRRNVRDGHYPIWGYVHFVAKTTDGNLSPQASNLIAWLNGAKASPNIDFVTLEAGAGYIPQCAMRVKRSSDGGLLSPYRPPQGCGCSAEAALSRTLPPGCIPCTSPSVCTGGLTCRHGFCE